MKALFPLIFILCSLAIADDKCKAIDEIKFDQHGTWKDYSYDWAKLGDYVVWNGENVPNKVINTKEKTECLLGYPNVRSIKKFKHHDLLFVDAFHKKLEYTAVIELKDCKKLWELEINTEISEKTFNSELKVITDNIKGSVLESCGHCWDGKTEACRNLPVSR